MGTLTMTRTSMIIFSALIAVTNPASANPFTFYCAGDGIEKVKVGGGNSTGNGWIEVTIGNQRVRTDGSYSFVGNSLRVSTQITDFDYDVGKGRGYVRHGRKQATCRR